MPTSSPKAAPSGDARLASLRKVCGEIDKLVDRYEQEQLPTDGRMPVLDAKAELMLNYTTQLVGYVQESVRSGRSGDVDPSVFESLFRTRLVLTKLRPIETKLEYSIERILNEVGLCSHCKRRVQSQFDVVCSHYSGCSHWSFQRER